MKYLLSAVVLIVICGCAAETKTYVSSISKHPVFLRLKPDGSYLIEQHFKYTIHEMGRWWELDESTLVLLPDDTSKQAHFARVGSAATPRGYLLYPDLRSAINLETSIGTIPAGLADELANHSLPGIYPR